MAFTFNGWVSLAGLHGVPGTGDQAHGGLGLAFLGE
jgi:hypothetical protein